MTAGRRSGPERDPDRRACDGEVCLTCSDEALPWTVVALDGDLAWVDTGAGYEEVSVALVDAAVGDVVLVHAGEAIARLTGAASPDLRADARRDPA